ncbi:extracellular solute-binding protein [Microbacterium terregens]|uniref:Extracellular solute-binding protein n=1 Tax=Microbacterium terregens TaxID=69363 RepID=A0ABV5T3K8_9MICO
MLKKKNRLRTPLATAGLVGALSIALVACGGTANPASTGEGAAPQSDVTLIWEATGASEDRRKIAYQDPFTAETGIKIESVSSPSAVAQIQTMVDAGNVIWDMTHKGSYTANQYCGTLFEELSFDGLSVDAFPEGSTTPCSRPVARYGSAFAYDAAVYTDKVPTKITDFFDVETFPGKRVILGTNARGVLEAALVADGVHPDDLFPMDVDRAIAKLDTIKDDIIFSPTLPALQQTLVDKQATMTLALTGTLPTANDAGATMAPVWDFTAWSFDAFMVIKGSKHAAEAEQFIEFALQPERVKHYAELGGTTPVRLDVDLATIKYTDSQKLFNPFIGEVIDEERGTLTLQDPDWWAENSSSATEAYVAWQVG